MTPPSDVRGMRVVMVNWRDGGHPEAGGAELFCEEIAGRMVALGAEVTLLVGRGRGQAAEEVVRGVQVVRQGGRWTVYPRALRFLAAHRAEIDLVIDCQNGLPFFSPLAVPRRTPVVLLIHHVHQDQFRVHFPAPLARVGQWLEGPASRRVYGDRAVAVVSPSTRTEVRLRLRLRGPVHVVPNGVTVSRPSGTPRTRSSSPTIVCVGRLVVHKRMDRLLHALRFVRAAHPDLVLHVVGDGPERRHLEHLAEVLELGSSVRFHGRVDAEVRDSLLASAWLTVNPSMGEGWGLGVLEAAALGTPAVVADVPGLRDAVRPGETGWLVPEGEDLGAAVARVVSVLRDETEAEAWSARCQAWAGAFTWDRSTRRLVNVALDERTRRARGRREQRRRSDLITWAEVHTPSPDEFAQRAQELLRPHDLVQQGDERAWLLCHACDELDMETVSSRLGVDLIAAEVATRAHLLGDLVPAAARPLAAGSAGS